MSPTGKLATLFEDSSNRKPAVVGVLVVRGDVIRAGTTGNSDGAALFGTIDRSGGDLIIRAESTECAAGFVQVGVLGGQAAEASAGEAWLTVSDPPAAWLDGSPMEVIINDPSRYRDRITALPGAAALQGKTAVVVGLGSVGSDLGARLVRLGVRTIGCDPDVLVVENLIRWGLPALADRDVGRSKARVWREILGATVPDARLDSHAVDVVRQGAAFDAIMRAERPDLLIAATDTADSRRVANAAAARHGVPALFVALSDGAASVRVEVVNDARRGPCHLCATRAEGGIAEAGTAPKASLTPYAAEIAPANTAVPALPVDVAIGAAIATRIAVTMLSGGDWQQYFRHGDQRGNVLFLSLRPDFWVFDEAWDRFVYEVERAPDCPACGEEEQSHGH